MTTSRIAAVAVSATLLAGCSTAAVQQSPRSAASKGAPTGAPPPPSGHAANGLAYSTASPDRVQPMPAPGTCHYQGHGLWAEPDPHCTPGALNPAVTQANLDQTICRPGGYTSSVRPPEDVTEPEKLAGMAAYSNTSKPSKLENDHLVPISLGGAANDSRDMWPEINYPGATDQSYFENPKDVVELAEHDLVCERRLSLASAQAEIASDWVAAYRRYVRSTTHGFSRGSLTYLDPPYHLAPADASGTTPTGTTSTRPTTSGSSRGRWSWSPRS